MCHSIYKYKRFRYFILTYYILIKYSQWRDIVSNWYDIMYCKSHVGRDVPVSLKRNVSRMINVGYYRIK